MKKLLIISMLISVLFTGCFSSVEKMEEQERKAYVSYVENLSVHKLKTEYANTLASENEEKQNIVKAKLKNNFTIEEIEDEFDKMLKILDKTLIDAKMGDKKSIASLKNVLWIEKSSQKKYAEFVYFQETFKPLALEILGEKK